MNTSKRLLRDLRWCAETKDREMVLSSREAKQILADLDRLIPTVDVRTSGTKVTTSREGDT